MEPEVAARRKKDFGSALKKFLSNYTRNVIARIDMLIEKRREQEIRDEDSLFAQELHLNDLKKQLESAAAIAEKSAPDFANDFDQLLNMEGIGRVDVQDKTLTIITHPITQTTDNGAFDIGSFVICIDFAHNDRTRGITFYPGYYSGSHRHIHANVTGTCFGQDLNPKVQKLFADAEIVSLVHLLLSFLRLENTSPQQDGSFPINPFQQSTKTPRDGRLPRYESTDEIKTSKERFIQFCLKIQQTRIQDPLISQIVMVENSLITIEDRIGHERKFLQGLMIVRANLANESDAKATLREADALANRDDVLAITAQGDYLVIEFGLKGARLSLSVSHKKRPRIFSRVSPIFQFGEALRPNGLMNLPKERMAEIIEAQFNRRFSDILRIVIDHLNEAHRQHQGKPFPGGQHGPLF